MRIPAATLCLLACTLSSAATPATAPTKLRPGAKPGTFHLRFEDRIQFSMEPAPPVEVSIEFHGRRFAELKVADGKPFHLDTDLQPGTYAVWLRPPKGIDEPRVEAVVHIGPDGSIYVRKPFTTIGMGSMISGLHPGVMRVIDQKRPMLIWTAVDGAVEYHLEWSEYRWPRDWRDFPLAVAHEATVHCPKYTFEHELAPGRVCAWKVSALDKDHRILAEGRAAFLSAGTDVAAHMVTIATQPAPPFPAAGSGYLGLLFHPLTGGGHEDEVDFGIMVEAVTPGSPASHTELRPGDIIDKLNDIPVDGEHSEVFTERIAATRPGEVVTLTVRHVGDDGWLEPEERAVTVTVGTRPADISGE